MSSFISLQSAVDLTTEFRSEREAMLETNYQDNNTLPISETFEKSHVQSVINQTGCQKLRVYYGMDGDSKVHAILVAVDSNDADILTIGDQSAYILEQGVRCPEDCGPNSALNS